MRWRLLIWWLLVAAGLVCAAVGDWRFIADADLRAHAAWWLGGVGCLAIAAWWNDRGAESPRGRRWTRAETVAVLSIALVAVFMRVWGLTAYPPPDAFGFEEFQTGALAYDVYRYGRWSLEFPLTNLLPGLSFRLFGLSSYALRAPFVLGGVLAPIVLFVALRSLVAVPAAWAAAMLLAASRWAAAGARFADEIYFPAAIVALAFWLLVRAVRRQRHTTTFAFALLSSDFFYAYSGYRIFPLVAFAGAALVALVQWRRGRVPGGIVRHFVLAAGVWAILLGPGVVNDFYHGGQVLVEALGRHGYGWIISPETGALRVRWDMLLARLRAGWELFATEGDREPTLNIPGEPMCDPLTAALGMLCIVAALWRWRDPWRVLTLIAFMLPFLVLALVPLNFNPSRYFVLIVPLYVLIGFFIDDLLRWRLVAPQWTGAVVAVAVAGAALMNFRTLQRVIDSPVVQAWFDGPENTVLAAIHQAPARARVVLLTFDGNNAFDPSDYSWYTAHLRGGRPDSLADALTLRADDQHAVYWVTQGAPEAELLPHLVRLVCPHAGATIRRTEKPMATVGVSWVGSGDGCGALPSVGLRAAYAVDDPQRGTLTTQQIDPALMAHTIPAGLGLELADRRITELRAQWSGRVIPRAAGQYRLRLELLNASGVLRLGDEEATATAPPEEWKSSQLFVALENEPLPVHVSIRAQPGARPAVRLYWMPPGEPEQLVPPSALRPAAADS